MIPAESATLAAVMLLAAQTPGRPVTIPAELGARIQSQLSARCAARIEEIRREQRPTAACLSLVLD